MNWIFSPCGTSLLTNEAKNDEKTFITQNSNARTEEDIPDGQRNIVQDIIDRVNSNLEKSDKNQIKKLSAELNGIITFYEKNKHYNAEQDMHYLITTDTFFGKETAQMIENWIKKNITKNVCQIPVERLQTRNYSDFKTAMLKLTEVLDKIIQDKKKHKIIFNLTGGFKSVQGYLQALGMLWNVDEIIYIFEQSAELISIPKLPLKIDMSIFTDESNLQFFRRFDIGLEVDNNKIKNFPQSLFEEAGDLIDFSNWGKALWSKAKSDIYKEKLLPSPSLKIKYSDKFISSVEKFKERLDQINQKIDDLSKFIESKDKKSANLKSLDFKELKEDRYLPSTHELDAWHDQDGKRIFCHFDKNGDLILDKLDKALH